MFYITLISPSNFCSHVRGPRISVVLRSWNRYFRSLNRILTELTGNFDNLTSNICQHWLIVNHILPLESPWSGITPLKDPWPYLLTFLDTKYGFFENFESIKKFHFWKYGKFFMRMTMTRSWIAYKQLIKVKVKQKSSEMNPDIIRK